MLAVIPVMPALIAQQYGLPPSCRASSASRCSTSFEFPPAALYALALVALVALDQDESSSSSCSPGRSRTSSSASRWPRWRSDYAARASGPSPDYRVAEVSSDTDAVRSWARAPGRNPSIRPGRHCSSHFREPRSASTSLRLPSRTCRALSARAWAWSPTRESRQRKLPQRESWYTLSRARLPLAGLVVVLLEVTVRVAHSLALRIRLPGTQ